MAMDETDRVLIKGVIGFGVLAGVLFFWPFSVPAEGFWNQREKIKQRTESLKPKFGEYVRYHPTQTGVVIGKAGESAPIGPFGTTSMAERLDDYRRKSEELRRLIVEKESASRMDFADWTEVPALEKEPGFYFQRKWDQVRWKLENESRQKNVDIMDRNIGFEKEWDVRMPRERAEQLLRQLFIAEKVITLCMTARQEQEGLERKGGLKPEAFMRIISVTPEFPVQIGPYSRTPNPKHNKDERNPKAEGYQKYITREWDKFILMYPVEIRLQCDINSFRNFLNSVRSQKGQFLVIRNLEIVSPFMRDSKVDESAWTRLLPRGGDDNDFKDEHVLVKLSAAGMDFFEPEKKPRKPLVPATDTSVPVVRVPLGH